MGENTPQKQSWAEKPFLERLGIVLGILASIVAIVGGIYFLWDRYGPSEPVDATEVTTTEEITTEAHTTIAESTIEEATTTVSSTAEITEATIRTTSTTTIKTTTQNPVGPGNAIADWINWILEGQEETTT